MCSVLLIPLQELLEGPAEGEACPAYADVLPEPQVLHLVLGAAVLPVPWLLGLVGLDAADVVGRALHQPLHQVVGLFLKEVTINTHHASSEGDKLFVKTKTI